jgi:heat shock protein HtpX
MQDRPRKIERARQREFVHPTAVFIPLMDMSTLAKASTRAGPAGQLVAGVFTNYAKTVVLMAALVAQLAIGGHAVGGYQGMMMFGGLGLLMNFVMYWFSDRIALMAHHAREVSRAQAPTLFAIIEHLCRRANLPMPRVHVIPSRALNAFATGRNPQHAAVAVTEGLLEVLDERQLEAVLAHELSHVRNRDVLIATVAAGVAGLISSVGYVLQFGTMLGGHGRDDENRGGGLAALAWIIVAPIVAVLIQMAISRSREFSADASGAVLTGNPDALADALATLERAQQVAPYEHAGPATAHLFIVNPLRGRLGAVMKLLSTHPPIEERIARLRSMR